MASISTASMPTPNGKKRGPIRHRAWWRSSLRFQAYAKQRNAGFQIVVQNAEELLEEAAYLRVIDAVAKEDLLHGVDHTDTPKSRRGSEPQRGPSSTRAQSWQRRVRGRILVPPRGHRGGRTAINAGAGVRCRILRRGRCTSLGMTDEDYLSAGWAAGPPGRAGHRQFGVSACPGACRSSRGRKGHGANPARDRFHRSART